MLDRTMSRKVLVSVKRKKGEEGEPRKEQRGCVLPAILSHMNIAEMEMMVKRCGNAHSPTKVRSTKSPAHSARCSPRV